VRRAWLLCGTRRMVRHSLPPPEALPLGGLTAVRRARRPPRPGPTGGPPAAVRRRRLSGPGPGASTLTGPGPGPGELDDRPLQRVPAVLGTPFDRGVDVRGQERKSVV